MIIGSIFFAFVAACALVLLVAIIKSTFEETRAVAEATPARPSHHVILPGEPEERLQAAPARTGRFTRERERQTVR
jgi:cell division protein FtsN